ncbi:hypothetical protein FB45DRAFT_860880 [Roridomyces roridus]|uniref:Uncharacterized protein n=1 Tax=Roridomyces roridus TaxID=1738132 RepID=A0AAD7CG90_9AGAR|nr:hypothetical protein FB45DRAFT_860880 [Roridomyces roridus]
MTQRLSLRLKNSLKRAECARASRETDPLHLQSRAIQPPQPHTLMQKISASGLPSIQKKANGLLLKTTRVSVSFSFDLSVRLLPATEILVESPWLRATSALGRGNETRTPTEMRHWYKMIPHETPELVLLTGTLPALVLRPRLRYLACHAAQIQTSGNTSPGIFGTFCQNLPKILRIAEYPKNEQEYVSPNKNTKTFGTFGVDIGIG